MRRLWIPAVILPLVVVAIVSGQSMLESAAAAAGGSAAGVAGKKVSEGLDAVFGKVNDVAKKSADDKPRKQAPAVPPIPTVRLADKNAVEEGDATPKAKAAVPVAARRQTVPNPSSKVTPKASETPVDPPAVVVPAPVEPTVSDLQAVSVGTSREDVLGKFGKPASRITMSDGDGLIEVYRFKNKDGALGSVRMLNGKVSEVKPALQ